MFSRWKRHRFVGLLSPFTSQRLGETPRPLWESGRKSVGFSACFYSCVLGFLSYEVFISQYCHSERKFFWNKKIVVEESHNFLNENSCLSFIVYYIDLHHITLSFLIISRGKRHRFLSVPIPLEPPLPPNDSGKPRDPFEKVEENLLDFLLLVILFCSNFKLLLFYF